MYLAMGRENGLREADAADRADRSDVMEKRAEGNKKRGNAGSDLGEPAHRERAGEVAAFLFDYPG